jgi:hypothetical protein
MLIKSVIKQGNRGGEPVLYTAEECATFAVEYGVRSKNTLDTVYWVPRNSVKVDNVSSSKGDTGSWAAEATGTAMIGKTIAKTDEFFEPKLHSFHVKYKSSKDNLGLPDIQIVEMTIAPVSTNPTDLMGFAHPSDEVVTPPVPGVVPGDLSQLKAFFNDMTPVPPPAAIIKSKKVSQ